MLFLNSFSYIQLVKYLATLRIIVLISKKHHNIQPCLHTLFDKDDRNSFRFVATEQFFCPILFNIIPFLANTNTDIQIFEQITLENYSSSYFTL